MTALFSRHHHSNFQLHLFCSKLNQSNVVFVVFLCRHQVIQKLLRIVFMASPLGSEDDLKKLTVPQLKLMCKERCITGYTKLPKAGVIGKLLDWRKQNCPQTLTPGLTTKAPAQTSSADVLENGRSMVQAPDSTILVQRRSSSKAFHSKEVVTPLSAPNTSVANSSIINILTLGNSPVSSPSYSQQVQVSVLSQGRPVHEKDTVFLNKPIDSPKATPAPIPAKRPQDKRDSGAERGCKKA